MDWVGDVGLVHWSNDSYWSPQELCDVLLDDQHCNSSESHDWNVSGVSHVQNELCVVKQCRFDYTTFQQSYIYNYVFIPTWMNSNRELNGLHRWLWAQSWKKKLPQLYLQYQRIFLALNTPDQIYLPFSSPRLLGSFCVDPGYICYLNILLYHWSFMRARVGVSTTVLFVTRGGNCK